MAARGINKVILVGNLGNEPDVRPMSSGGAVTNISIATSETWKDKNTGDMQERTEWHRVVFFGKLGEIAGQYLHKGSKVYVEGALRTEKWTDNSGNERYTTKIIANEMQMLDKKGDVVASQPETAQSSTLPDASNPKPADQAAMDAWDDDIPF